MPKRTELFVLALLLIAMGLAIVVYAAKATDNMVIPPEGKYHLQALVAKRAALDSQLNALYVQFVNSNEQAKQIVQQEQGIAKEQDALVDELFKTAGLKKEEYQIDADAGVFKAIKKEKAK